MSEAMPSAIQPPVAKAAMLIRRPVAEVFNAFVDPAVTSRFWFTRGSGPLATGARVEWEWEMYGVSAPVDVIAVEPERRIEIEWPGEDGQNRVEWLFTPLGADATFVSITNSGFHGDVEAMVRQAIDATEAFTMVLAGLKALLEHNVQLNLVADRFPPELGTP